MSTLTINPGAISADVAAGTNLLQAILAAGGKLVSKCGGDAKCGACHVFVTEGRKGLSKMRSGAFVSGAATSGLLATPGRRLP